MNVMSYKEAEALFSEEIQALGERPTPIQKYHAYKNGECTVFDDRKLAEKEGFKHIEPFIENMQEIAEYGLKYNEVYGKVESAWYDSLKESYKAEYDLTDAVFEVCYNEAYERGHHSGHDEVSNCLIGVVEFYKKIVEAQKFDQ